MWGGRFTMSPAEIMQEINASIGFDKALAPQDIRASKAHAAMLAAQGIISKDDAKKINAGLDKVLAEIEGGTFQFSRALEDIHMNVESRLKELIGEPAGRLHTARSRNDQVATDFRLWVRDWIDAARSGAGGPATGARPQGRDPRRAGHAGLHAPAAGPAGHLRPSPAGLCRDAGPRPRPLRRCPQAAQRMPAGRRRAGRHVVPDRSPRHGRGARLRPADRQFARQRLRPRLRAGDAGGGGHLRPCTCRASPRRSSSG